MHVTQAAQAFGTAAKQRTPAGSSVTGQWFLCRPGRRVCCVPTAPRSRLLWNSPAAASMGMAMRIARPDGMRQQGCACPGCYRQDDSAGSLPYWHSPSGGSPPIPPSSARPGSPFEASTAPVTAAVPSPPREDGRVPGGVTHHVAAGPFAAPLPRWCNSRRRASPCALCAVFHAGYPRGDGTSLLRCR
jgi:hypothetical protein